MLFGVVLFLVLFALSYGLLWGLRLIARLLVAWQPWRFAALAVLLLCAAAGAGCVPETGGSGSSVCANTTASATTPSGPNAGAVAATLLDCTAPDLEQLISELIPQVQQKLEGGSPNFVADLTALESQGPAAVACAGQRLLSAACAPASSVTTGPTNLARPLGAAAVTRPAAPPKLSPAATERAQKYLQSVAGRGFRIKS